MGVRRGDLVVLAWLVALFAVTQAGHGLGSNTGDALFFVRFGVEFLPVMILLSGITVMTVTVGYAAGLARFGATRLLPGVAWTLAALIAVERLMVATDAAAVYAVIWLTEQVVVLVTFTMMWGAAGEACDARQAKRVFPVVASAGIAGGFVGNLATGPLAALLGTPNLLMIHAALLAVMGVLLVRIATRFFPAGRPVRGGALRELRGGLSATARSSLFRRTSLVAFVFSLVFFLVVVPFAEMVTAVYANEAEVAAFLGYFSAAATAASFVVSLVLANRLLALVGVVGVVLIVPVVYAIGFALWLVSFTLLTAALVRGAQWIAVNALGATAWQSLFNVARPPRRGQIMAFVTAVPTQLGVVAAGIVLVLGLADLPVRVLSAVGLALAVATAEVVRRMRPSYVADLLAALRDGVGDVLTAATRGPRTFAVGADGRRALVAALGSAQVATRRVAVAMVGRLDDPIALDLLVPAAADADGAVRAAATARLAEIDSPRAVALTVAALDDADGRVRRVAVRAAGRRDPAAAAVRRALGDPDPAVRAQSVAMLRDPGAGDVAAELLRSADEHEITAGIAAARDWPQAPVGTELHALLAHPRPRIRLGAAGAVAARGDPDAAGPLLLLLDDPDPGVRAGVADLLNELAPDVGGLVQCLDEGSPRAQAAAVRALRGRPAAYNAVADWAIGRAERAQELRSYRAELTAEPTAAASGRRYLVRVLVQREWRSVRDVLEAVDALAGGDAVHLLTRAARDDDAQVRAQAVEAVDSMAERPLARRLVSLLEDAPPQRSRVATMTSWSVLDDADPWLRALGVRAVVDQISALRRRLDDRAGSDDSPLVAEALRALKETTVSTSDDTTGLIDRILALQQVPMFSDLEPEDLERIAERCERRSYGADERIYGQGDLGREMLVITAGSVRIVRREGGRAHEVRHYGAGDHVGELSLLRGQPRVADVVAGAEGAEGLSLDATSLRGILTDRPEVVMAMLATLAERLSVM